MGTHDHLSAEIPDIFIPPTQIGNAGVMRGRNENSGMTTERDSTPPPLRGWIVPVGDIIPDRRGPDVIRNLSPTRSRRRTPDRK